MRWLSPKATKANSPPAASSMPARMDCMRVIPNMGPTAAMTPTCSAQHEDLSEMTGGTRTGFAHDKHHQRPASQ
jgi:hypothetical protein